LTSRFLLDTHILIRYRSDPKRLSREQTRVIDEAVERHESLAISAITLLEIALLDGEGSIRTKIGMDQLFGTLEGSPIFAILPLTIDIAREVSFLGALRDPSDRVIVATARVHGLRLLTSDQRILDSNIVSAIK
jgi:PIN domain nuclease of toxin-antitoxin system